MEAMDFSELQKLFEINDLLDKKIFPITFVQYNSNQITFSKNNISVYIKVDLEMNIYCLKIISGKGVKETIHCLQKEIFDVNILLLKNIQEMKV